MPPREPWISSNQSYHEHSSCTHVILLLSFWHLLWLAFSIKFLFYVFLIQHLHFCALKTILLFTICYYHFTLHFLISVTLLAELLSSVLFHPSWAIHCVAAIAHTHIQPAKYEFWWYKYTDSHLTPTSLVLEVHFIHQYTWSIMTVFHPFFFFLDT